MTRDDIKEVVFEEVAKVLEIPMSEVIEEMLLDPYPYLTIFNGALYRLDEKAGTTRFVNQFVPKGTRPVSQIVNSMVISFKD